MSLKQEFSSLTRAEKLFILFAMLVGFCISTEYSITRPASHSLFLGVFTAQQFPVVWLATIPLNLAIVALYSKFLPRLGALKMMTCTIGTIMGINFVTPLILPVAPQFIFFHFCWKDIYILLMFKQLWSMIHTTIPSRAKYIYGTIFGVSTCGAALGSLIPAFLALKVGSEQLFFFTVPIYLLALIGFFKAYQFSRIESLSISNLSKQFRASEGFTLIAKNRYLLGVLFLVVFMQVSVAFIEYQFSHELEITFPLKDARTAFYGKALSFINLISLLVQFGGVFLILQWIGLRGSHFLVPLLLCGAALGQFAFPGFIMAAAAFIFTKSVDFSLFGVVREMLFIPLSVDEKYRAKAVIDVFAYRTSKAFASLLLLGLQAWVGTAVFSMASYLSIAIFCTWIALVALLFRNKKPIIAN